MRVPVDWLREYVAVPADATGVQIAADLVRVGLEEEGLHGGGVTGPLVVGRVLSKEPEPQKNGKTINWCSLDVGEANGTGEPQWVVCGAHNFEVGDLVAVILPGGVLPTPEGPLTVSARTTYGHVSAGMICSERELGLGDDHDGIIVLTRRFAGDEEQLARLVPGADAIPILGLDRETVEVNVTHDRGYCFSIRGIAREYSHATGAAYTDPVVALAAAAPAANGGGYAVELADEAPIRGRVGCSRYVARIVRGLDVSAPTPGWMKTRLTEAGMRPISLAVDVTNYVMLGLGQPLHAFDLARLRESSSCAGRAPGADDDPRRHGCALSPEDLLITDSGQTPIAIAASWVSTEVSSTTTDVLIGPHTSTRCQSRGARRKGPSEASRRFERESIQSSTHGCTVGGRSARAMARDGRRRRHRRGEAPESSIILMDVGYPTQLVVDYDRTTVCRILTEIGCQVIEDGPTLAVTPPSWRPDLRTAPDLVEEVARIDGYDRIPSVVPTPPGGRGLTHGQQVRRLVADVLAGAGLTEIWSAPFVGAARHTALGWAADEARARTVALANPLSDEAPLMRISVLSTMVDALVRNVARGARDVGLFEIGLVVARDGEQTSAPTEDVGVQPSPEVLAAIHRAVPRQPRHLAILLAGDRDRAGWWGEGRPADVSDVLGLVRSVADALAVPVVLSGSADVMPFHPGRCAAISLADGTLVGHAGELHPRVVAALGRPSRTVAAELDLDVLIAASEDPVAARPLVASPAAYTDLAVVVDEAVTAGSLEASLGTGAGEMLESITLFDVYRGDQVGPGRKSLAYRLAFRAPDRTLRTEEVSALRDAALARAAADLGATQRT